MAMGLGIIGTNARRTRIGPVCHCTSYMRIQDTLFVMAPSFEARETHRCLKNRLGIVRARGRG